MDAPKRRNANGPGACRGPNLQVICLLHVARVHVPPRRHQRSTEFKNGSARPWRSNGNLGVEYFSDDPSARAHRSHFEIISVLYTD